MIKVLQKSVFIIFSLLLFLPTTMLAAQCPASSEWSHTKGSEWTLSDKAKAEGWIISPVSYQDSKQTTIPADSTLDVSLSSYHSACIYYLNDEVGDIVIAESFTQLADLDKLPQPPFIHVTRDGSFVCKTTSGASEVCRW